ncbi:hypothetical protein MY10362_008087 [Beauveria mimosiformis]
MPTLSLIARTMPKLGQTRTLYTGSCHCGAIQYMLHLDVPHVRSEQMPAPRGVQHMYRCNCTLCHKTGYMHVRPASPTHDFLLLSPLEPLAELGDYVTGAGNLHFLYCTICAVRCFVFAGDGELVDVDLDEMCGGGGGGGGGGSGASAVSGGKKRGGKVKAWRPRLGGGHPQMGHYLSVNAHSIDAGQGFDMRELSEKQNVMYCDCYSPEELEAPMRYGRPQENGSY